ncbi:MAG: methylated-DNA--[protein]-cysteine S-methyltransferase [Solidesulfovibrio sp. DCME]|uniref:methylated-DNA--[protein]-cysteine S-methyltransferase n=1 Tax=Solidesulfovibrio sp. DCME TaxID=3447380 RepID=UPI003D104538
MTTRTETCLAGPLALTIRWQGSEVASMSLAWSKGKTRHLVTEAGEAVQAALERYVAGEEPDWPALPWRLEGLSDFARQVLGELSRVPRGQMVSYGWLAAKAGRPKAARAVGRVMAQNPFPMLFPCHRVVGASGALTGFGPGLDMKRYLLEREGALHRKT